MMKPLETADCGSRDHRRLHVLALCPAHAAEASDEHQPGGIGLIILISCTRHQPRLTIFPLIPAIEHKQARLRSPEQRFLGKRLQARIKHRFALPTNAHIESPARRSQQGLPRTRLRRYRRLSRRLSRPDRAPAKDRHGLRRRHIPIRAEIHSS